MSRCVKSEKMGRPIFYGAMITEGIVALIWATVASWFFYGEPAPGYELIEAATNGFHTSAPAVVNIVCNDWLGMAGAILAMLGVVAAPITSGDTAFRSGRLIVAEWLKKQEVLLDYADSCALHDDRLFHIYLHLQADAPPARDNCLSVGHRLSRCSLRVVCSMV